LSALSTAREVWRRAEAKRLETAREAEEAFLQYNAEQRADARERGLLQDHYRKSTVLMKAEKVSLSTAELIDGITESAKNLRDRVMGKPKVEVLSLVASHEEVREERIVKSEPSRWQRFLGWCKRKWTQFKKIFVTVFAFVVEVLVMIDGKKVFLREVGRAARLLYEQYRRYKVTRVAAAAVA
jgi:hypothetical protein